MADNIRVEGNYLIDGDGNILIDGDGNRIEIGNITITQLREFEPFDESVKHRLRSIYQEKIYHSPEAAKNYLALGLYYLDFRRYKQAISALEKADERAVDNADIKYYLALAHIGGKRPKTLTLSQVREIEDYLEFAIELDNSQTHYYCLWALLKQDFYSLNGLRSSLPDVYTLLEKAQHQECIQNEIHKMLEHVPVPSSPVKEKISKLS